MFVHFLHHGELSTLRRPRTFSQLLAARNLLPWDPLVSTTADKYLGRDYVASRIGEQHLIPLLAVLNSPDEFDAENIPVPCVIKATHGYDMNLLVRKDSPVDKAGILARVNQWFSTDFYKYGWKERPYKHLKPRVVIEEFLGDGVTPPSDYKFYVFHGQVGMIQVDEDRFSDHRTNMFDAKFRRIRTETHYAASESVPKRPENLEQMIEIAEKLAAEFDFARIDLYSVEGRIYFGEITHYPGGGAIGLRPREVDLALGELWLNGTELPSRLIEK